MTCQIETSAFGGKICFASSVISSSMIWVWCLIISQPAPAASRTISFATARSPPWLMPISAMTRGGWFGPISRWAIFMGNSVG